MTVLISGIPHKIIRVSSIVIHPDPLPKNKGEKYAKYQPQKFYTAVLTEPLKNNDQAS